MVNTSLRSKLHKKFSKARFENGFQNVYPKFNFEKLNDRELYY